ncbi:MAG: RNA methyltransferase [Chloroflexi bacterium]|nr:RNA methyltransferase [Chloroflexota bacterium]
MQEVLPWRTRYVTLVLEDIYQPQNASATLRTAELLGVQEVYILENWNEYRLNPDVTLGANKWLDLHRYRAADSNNTERAMHDLRRRGYRLVATSPHRPGYSPETIPLDRPLAFFFGNELKGLSEYALEHADLYLRLPMFGFTESYNISVSVALTLYPVIRRLHRSWYPWRLSPEEREAILVTWYRRAIGKHWRTIEAAFWAQYTREQPQDPSSALDQTKSQ